MLSNVAVAVSNSTRQVVLRHPNTMPCTVWRKKIIRVEVNPETDLPSEMGGSPTLGGMGVLRSEEEDDFEYIQLGTGKCLFCGIFQPTDQVERDNALLQSPMQEAQVECDAEPGTEGYFFADTTDMVIIEPGLGTALVYDVATLTGVANIPPYIRKLVLNPRDDLHALKPFLG
jgi:hypothetical protein